MTQAVRETSLKSVSILSVCSAGQLLGLFAFQLLLANYFGAGADMDAYLAALALPSVISTVLAGSLGFAVVPVFINQTQNRGEESAWRMAGTVGVAIAMSGIVLSLAFTVAARPLMALLQPGFSPQQVDQAARLFRILCWLIATNGLVSFLRVLYHCQGRFALTGLAPLLGIVLMLIYTWLAYPSQGIVAVAVGTMVGSVANLIALAPLWLRKSRWGWRIDSGSRRCASLLLPLLLGAACCNLDPLVDRYLASENPGTISHLGYAWRFTTAFLTLSTSGLAMALFPTLTSQIAAGRKESFCEEFAAALRFLIFLLTPLCAALLCFSRDIIRDLLERGLFHSSDTLSVAGLLTIYVGVLCGGSLGDIAAKAFYADQDTRTPILIGMCGVSVGIALKFLLFPRIGATGLAAATSIVYGMNAVWMLALIARKHHAAVFAGTARCLVRCLIGSLAALAVGYAVVRSEPSGTTILGGGLGAITYWLVMLAQRDEFAIRLSQFVRQRRPPASIDQ